MKTNLSFKDYRETKIKLMNADQNIPRVKHLYEVKKYCKIPLMYGINESENDKIYISLKPKDTLEILWEYETMEKPTPRHVCLTFDDDQIMYFAWSNAKVVKWIESSIDKVL